ncbi:hypothetical protein SAV14893_096650 [Streptomyces avermitilis]|uniref:Uncharacterized protein n=1 Tax=Streptomyces avermitilis TaxID=33903 RepID=A0A4D4ME73_STRAX|nr:hypothetical protein SAV14893_096650 [Streptomyces avermitilis]
MEPGGAKELRSGEPGGAYLGVSGGGVAERVKELAQQVFGEEGAAVVDVVAGSQAGQVGVTVCVGQMGKACGVAGHVDAAAADGVGGGVRAVCAVRPGRRRGDGGRGCAHGVVAPLSCAGSWSCSGRTHGWPGQFLPEYYTRSRTSASWNAALAVGVCADGPPSVVITRRSS